MSCPLGGLCQAREPDECCDNDCRHANAVIGEALYELTEAHMIYNLARLNAARRHALLAALLLGVASVPPLVDAFAATHGDSTLRAQSVSASDFPVMTHIHGLAYSRDGTRLFIATHNGLAVYHAGRWSMAPGAADDLTAIVATEGSLLSSGYSSTSGNAPNRLGLQRSRDNGVTWKALALSDQAALRVMGASYYARAIYVYNDSSNAVLRNQGFFYTQSDGTTWTVATARGVDIASAAHSLAVHPTQPGVVAASTDTGLLISEDFAQHFQHVYGKDFALAAWFDFDGIHIWLSQYLTRSRLTRLRWKDGKDANDVALPMSDEDGIAFICQNPVDFRQIVIATFKRDVYLSDDQGGTWRRIVDRGQAT